MSTVVKAEAVVIGGREGGVTEHVPEDLNALAECERSRPILGRASFGGARTMV